jgi:hypothetical protein
MRRPRDVACGQSRRSCRDFSDLSHKGLCSIIRQTINMEMMLVTLTAILWRNNVWGLTA